MLLTVPTLNNYSVGLGLGLALRRPVTQFSSSHQTQRLNSFLRWFSPVRTMSTDGLKGPLVGPQQLHQLMNTEGGELVILDASWYMDKSRNAYKEYVESHIPGARFLDIDHVCDQQTDLPHMLPDKDFFAECMANLGVSKSKRVVVYDGHGMFSAPRAWWMLRVFGHPSVQVLNGGFPNWVSHGYPTDSGKPSDVLVEKEEWILQEDHVADPKQVLHVIDKSDENNENDTLIVDARSGERFDGTAPEPRPGIPSGHMPKSINVPFTKLLNEKNQMISPEDIRKEFERRGVSPHRQGKIISSCGTGVTASTLYLGLTACGRDQQSLAVYDGSWSEYAVKPDAKIVKKDDK